MPPAVRLGDMHICPIVTGVVPHVGGSHHAALRTDSDHRWDAALRVTDHGACIDPPYATVKD